MVDHASRPGARAEKTLRAMKLNPIAAACLVVLFASANAYAQDAAAPQTEAEKKAAEEAAAKGKANEQPVEIEAVQVTGIRRGIENAIDTKQSATSIVESISAEDIGKLPDSSIAESIARLPGLTAQRERGRATQINIRGFAGDFAGTTLNGREQTSTGDNRGVEFDQYPSELLQSVVVYKTPDATLVGQGLSGTVDLQTARPLSYSDRVISANYRVDQNKVEGNKEYGNRYSFAYIDQFLDNTVGIAIGYSHLDSPQPGFQNEAWGYPDPDGGGPLTGVFGGGKIYKFDDNLDRDGLMATLQFKPNDFYEGTLDIFYSHFKKTELKTGMEFGTAWGQGIPDTVNYEVNDAGTVVESHWTNVKPVIRMDSNPIDDHLRSFGFNNKFRINDHWKLVVDYSTNRTRREFRVLETYAGLAGPGGGTTDVDVVLDPSGQFYNFTFSEDFNDPSNLQLIDAGGWGQDGYLKDFQVEDRLHALRVAANVGFDSGFLRSIDFGVNRTDRDKTKTSDEFKLCLVACAGVGDSAPFPGSPGEFGLFGLNGLAMYDANAMLNLWNLQAKFHPDIANKNWSIDETMTTFYAQANIDTDLGSVPLRGNFGFQWVGVDQSSEGFSTFSGNSAGTITSDGASYHHFLPSLNLSFGLPWEQYLRFAAARQMARPRLDDMRASFDVHVNTGICQGQTGVFWCGSGGNPRLKPWLANAYDLSYEKYFTTAAGNKGYVAAAYFFKDLQTYIYKADRPFDYAGFPLPPDDGVTPYPTSTLGSINQPFNGEGGTMKGIELSLSLPLDVFWRRLDGFGLQASYSDTKSSISPNGPGTSEPLPGLSKYVSNITGYYEHNGFSIRLSQRKRSAYRGETRGFGADLTLININAETVQDAQVNYSFNTGPLKGLGLYLQVSNIGDEPFTTSDAGDPAGRPIQYFEYGRTTLLGFSYKF
jgi:iron complex outermembrane receptor protein